MNILMASGTTMVAVGMYAWPHLLESLESRRDAKWARKMGK